MCCVSEDWWAVLNGIKAWLESCRMTNLGDGGRMLGTKDDVMRGWGKIRDDVRRTLGGSWGLWKMSRRNYGDQTQTQKTTEVEMKTRWKPGRSICGDGLLFITAVLAMIFMAVRKEPPLVPILNFNAYVHWVQFGVSTFVWDRRIRGMMKIAKKAWISNWYDLNSRSHICPN